MQAELTVGKQEDPAEREVDRIADEMARPSAEENQIGPPDGSAAESGSAPTEQHDNLVRRAVSAGQPMSAGWQQLVSGGRQDGRSLP